MTININMPEIKELHPRILVLGVGGAGGNAINGMIEAGLQGVEFIAVNTDAQDLKMNKAKEYVTAGGSVEAIKKKYKLKPAFYQELLKIKEINGQKAKDTKKVKK